MHVVHLRCGRGRDRLWDRQTRSGGRVSEQARQRATQPSGVAVKATSTTAGRGKSSNRGLGDAPSACAPSRVPPEPIDAIVPTPAGGMKTPNENHRSRPMLPAAVMKCFAISLVFLA